MNRFVIFNADDFGLCSSTNIAIKELFYNGFVTSTSLMAPAPMAENSIELVNLYSKIKCGMHTTLTSEWSSYRWKPLSGRKELTDGIYFPQLCQLCNEEEILREEVERQYEFFVKRGVDVNHVDDHMFALVNKMEILVELCAKYQKKLRLPRKNLIKGLSWDQQGRYLDLTRRFKIPTIDYLFKFPIHFDINMSYAEFKKIFLNLIRNLKEGISEIYIHPSLNGSDLKSICHERACKRRYYEFLLMQDIETLKTLEQEHISLIGWEDVLFDKN